MYLKSKVNQLLDYLADKLGYERRRSDSLLRAGLYDIDDLVHISYLDIAASKITNLSCVEATNEIKYESSLCAPLENISNTLQRLKSDIAHGALTKGGFYTVPYFDDSGTLRIMPLNSDYVRILKREGEQLRDVLIALETFTAKNGSIYFLIRRHTLDANGNLQITYFATQNGGALNNIPPFLPEHWKYCVENSEAYNGVNHIGFGYYRSPVNSRGIPTVEGVPMDFGCADTINKLRELDKLEGMEFSDGKRILFIHPSIAKQIQDNGKQKLTVAENVFLAGTGGMGTTIDDYIKQFNPEIRVEKYTPRRQELYVELENCMKLSRGIFTENTVTQGGTATEVRRSNAETLSFIDNVHNMLDRGDEMTLEACGIYLDIRRELWEYASDYFDPFADPDKQFEQIRLGVQDGAISMSTETMWLKPSLSPEEAEAEIQKAREERGSESDFDIDNEVEV